MSQIQGLSNQAQLPEVIRTGDDALQVLKQGNERFAANKQAERDIGAAKRESLLQSQNPFAIILSCADSRVPPEIIFDQGLGDLVVIRIAGNVCDTFALGSIEFAAESFDPLVLVVLGHSQCAAVKATLEGGEYTPSFGAVASTIWPSVEIAVARNSDESAIVEDAVVENVKAVIRNIKADSSLIRAMANEGRLKVIGAKYYLETGRVEFFE